MVSLRMGSLLPSFGFDLLQNRSRGVVLVPIDALRHRNFQAKTAGTLAGDLCLTGSPHRDRQVRDDDHQLLWFHRFGRMVLKPREERLPSIFRARVGCPSDGARATALLA